MLNEYETKFRESKRRSMDDFGFFRCPIDECVLCNAYNEIRCIGCVIYKEEKRRTLGSPTTSRTLSEDSLP